MTIVDKEQLETCKAIMRGGRAIGYTEYGNSQIAITYDGYSGFIVNKNDVVFNLDRARKIDQLAKYYDFEDYAPIKITKRYVNQAGLMCRVFENGGGTILAQQKYVNKFADCQFEYSNQGKSIRALSHIGQVIGFFMIVRGNENV